MMDAMAPTAVERTQCSLGPLLLSLLVIAELQPEPGPLPVTEPK